MVKQKYVKGNAKKNSPAGSSNFQTGPNHQAPLEGASMANRTNHTSLDQSTTTSQTEESEREQERRYGTRYGIRTAPDAARELVERSWARMRILEDLFEVAHHDGDGFTMTGYSSQGLAAILGDISHDMHAAFSYYLGEDPTPGKEYDTQEMGHE